MKNILYKRLITIMRILMIIAVLLQQNGARVEAQEVYTRIDSYDTPLIDFQSYIADPQLRDALVKVIVSRPLSILKSNRFVVGSEYANENWSLISIYVFDAENCLEESNDSQVCSATILAQNNDGDWEVEFAGTERFSSMLRTIPTEYITDEAKIALDPLRDSNVQATFTPKYLFPFEGKWAYWQKWHEAAGSYAAIDIGTNGPNYSVLASAGGIVKVLCKSKIGAVLSINDGANVLIYRHLDAKTLGKDIEGKDIHNGSKVAQGTYLGNLLLGSPNGRPDGCNGGYMAQQNYRGHIHWIIPKTFTVDGWIIQYPNEEFVKGETKLYDRKHDNPELISSNHRCPTPSNNMIILYSESNYGCSGKGEGSGYVSWNTIYATSGSSQLLFSVPANFGASSISIPRDLTAYVILHSKNGAKTINRYYSDPNFADNEFPNNDLASTSLNQLNDNIGSIEIIEFTSNFCPPSQARTSVLSTFSKMSATTLNCIPNISPNLPSLSQPYNGYISKDYIAPTLCWRSEDPDGNEVEYFVEIYNSPVNVKSGWIRNTCWQPSDLDNKYYNYQWHVKARDIPAYAESEWSATRSFSISPPNYPPSISFTTANIGTFPSGVIYSRDTNWIFSGSASDPEGQLNRVEWHCSGDSCGSQISHSGTSSWSHTQNNLSGRNDVYFMAYDNYGNTTSSRHLDLRIDLATPTTTPNLNGQSNTAQWPLWFTMPVNVKLHGADNGTGRATVGMGKIHYRLDNGLWQVVNGSDSAFTISSDGRHIVEYYSEDALGNTEASRSFSFQIDQTPPSLPANLQESHGTANGQWQKDQNIPDFIWNAATDATSGLRGYQLYFGDDPNGIGYKNILASEPRQWTPFPAGLPTGTSYLRARTQDNAGNWSAWATLFTFRYDGTPPENPSDITHTAGITTAWQKTSSSADFSWISAHDEGSGIKGYHVYWGIEPDATAATFVTANVFKDLTSLCATNASCTGYLRLRSEDNVGNLAEDWNTVFILRYDNAPPVVDFSFNGGATSTAQSQVTLNVITSDEGSGIYAVRFSDDGQNWKEWEQPADERLWNIYAISRQSWPVYAQVKDHVGLLSDVVQHDVYFDVNPAQPKSLNYRLFDHGFSGGSGSYGSTSYSGRGTLSQITNSPASSSVHYTLLNGYEAGSQASPLFVPGHEEYTSVDGIFASGVITDSLRSASYQMILTVGGIGLSSTTTIDSVNYQHQPGFLANVQWRQPAGPSVIEQPEVPAPDPEPLLACDAPLVSINNGEVYTDTPNVTLSLCAPYAVEMMVSAQMDFAGAVWEPFVFSKSWVISTAGSTVEPRFVYVQFRDVNGKLHAGYFDDILYDPNQPNGSLLLSDDINAQPPLADAQFNSMSANQSRGAATGSEPTALQAAPDGSVTLYVDGFDDNSGLVEMQISATPAFIDAVWQPFSPAISYVPGGGDGPRTVYARFQDEAGNLSGTAAIDFLYDTQPPDGYIYADPAVLPGDAITTTLYLGGYNSWDAYYDETTPTPTYDGGAVEMRLGSDPDLVSAYWQPLTDTVIVAVDPTLSEGAYYVQYRDAAGNVSEIYGTAYYIDTIAPNLSAEADPGDGDTRNISIYAEDDLSGIANLYLSNDPLMQLEAVTLEYTEKISWIYDSKKVVWIVAEDGVGNRSQPYPVYATELGDTANPLVTSITRDSVSPTSATSVNFTVTFSKSVIGVDETDFSLTTGGITNATVGGVSGMDSIYLVAVNSGNGNGTIRLDLIDNNSIVDAASNPLGGATMGDGNFTTGEVYNIAKSAGGDTTGVFRPSNGLLYLKNQNTTGFADVSINYGTGGDYPVAGDWDGNGTATIGIYRNGSFYLRNSNTLGFADIVFAFGTPGDQPVAGDWDGDGVDTIGVYSNGQFLLLNSNSAGTADMSFYLGNPGDVGIAGDWNGDGADTTGVFRPSNGIIFLKNANTTGFADIALNYGLAGDMPVTGDWNNDGIDTIGVYRNAQFLLRNSNTIGFAEIVFGLGNPGDMPISGNWDGIP